MTEDMSYIKREWKKLGSMGCVGLGSFLILEHIYTYGRINLLDILGHEWLGIVLVVGGLLWANVWTDKPREALKHAKDKIKWVFKRK